MNRRKLAKEITKIAGILVGMEFDTEEALKKYLDEHPGADKSLHSVKKTEGEKKEPTKAEKPKRDLATAKKEREKLQDEISDAFDTKNGEAFQRAFEFAIMEDHAGKMFDKVVNELPNKPTRKQWDAAWEKVKHDDADAFPEEWDAAVAAAAEGWNYHEFADTPNGRHWYDELGVGHSTLTKGRDFAKRFNDIDEEVTKLEGESKKEEPKKEEPKKEEPKKEEPKKEEPKKEEAKNVPHKKAKPKAGSLKKVQDVMKANKIENDSDELHELAGFKKTLGQRVPEGQEGKWYVRNKQKLKKDFLANMDASNYKSPEAFDAAKKRIQQMSTSDFAKVLAAIVAEDEE